MTDRLEASPLQIKQLLFSKIEIEAEVSPDETLWAPDFDFEGVIVHSNLEVIPQDDTDPPNTYLIILQLAVLNDAEEGGKPAPYRFEIHGHAMFEVAEGFNPETRESIIRINGASMIVAAMREMLTQLTSRSLWGPMTLPSLRFLPEHAES